MTVKIKISHEYEPGFEGVARRIAKGDPPEWLPIALEHFSPGIGEGPVDVEHVKRQMTDAIDLLCGFFLPLSTVGLALLGSERMSVPFVCFLPGIRADLNVSSAREQVEREMLVGRFVPL